MRKLLANENFPSTSIIVLRNAGFDVLAISTKEPELKESYNPEFTDKLDKSIQEGREGKIKFIKTEDLWK